MAPADDTHCCPRFQAEYDTWRHIEATYDIWRVAKSRCTKSSDRDYPNYGGRGIKFCERWARSFATFLSDMGPRPAKLRLERMDNDGPYSPDNCRWASAKDQARNRRRQRILTHDGKTMCLSAWAEHIGINREALNNRLIRGWSVAKTLTTALFPMTKRSRAPDGKFID